MKEHKLPKEILEKIKSSKHKVSQIETNNLTLKLNLAQIQINLLQGISQIECEKASINGLLQGYAINKKLNLDKIELSEDGLSIVTND